jgi:two-component system sensor histidine kinase DesK
VARLRVCNDGAVAGPGASGGTGLDMLAERLAAVGGTLTHEHQGDRFVLAASLPLDASGEAG